MYQYYCNLTNQSNIISIEKRIKIIYVEQISNPIYLPFHYNLQIYQIYYKY